MTTVVKRLTSQHCRRAYKGVNGLLQGLIPCEFAVMLDMCGAIYLQAVYHYAKMYAAFIHQQDMSDAVETELVELANGTWKTLIQQIEARLNKEYDASV